MKNLYLVHYGIKGQKWGKRRFQYEDGDLTPEGEKRYSREQNSYKPGSGPYKAPLRSYKIYNEGGIGTRSYMETGQIYGPKFDDGKGHYYSTSSSGPKGRNHGGTHGNWWTTEQKRQESREILDNYRKGLDQQRREDTKAPGSESMNNDDGSPIRYEYHNRGEDGSILRNVETKIREKEEKDRRNLLRNRETDTKAPGSENQNTYTPTPKPQNGPGSENQNTYIQKPRPKSGPGSENQNTYIQMPASKIGKTQTASTGREWIKKFFGQTR